MQHSSVCPGCGRSVGTRYAFMHQSGRTVTVFCLASCFVRWHREQKWTHYGFRMRTASGRVVGTRIRRPGKSVNLV